MSEFTNDPQSRRRFLKQAAALAATTTLARPGTSPAAYAAPKSPNERLRAGAVGTFARARANINGISQAGVDIVAMADVDTNRMAETSKSFPKTKTFEDFRHVLDYEDLDILIVGTPDHTHAIPVAEGLRRGMAVYCEKPLAHSVHECRVIRNLAAEKNAVTQMGSQIHSGDNYRRVVEEVHAGTIGDVKRVHVWLGNGPTVVGKRVKKAEVPKGINYDLWLGPAPYRPFHVSHFHFDWRYWWDFGGGWLADFGCHYMDLPFWALDLRYPTSVVAKGEKAHEGDNEVPHKMQVDYQFPARGDQPPVHLTWYHGGWMPEGAEVYNKKSAVLFEGDKGRILADYGSKKVFLDNGKDAEPVEQTIPNSIGHHKEFVEAVKTGGPTTCNFDYSGALAEAVLLGNVSYRTGGKELQWDAENLKATNAPEADQYIQREYRKGWTL